jgi:CysZ protein
MGGHGRAQFGRRQPPEPTIVRAGRRAAAAMNSSPSARPGFRVGFSSFFSGLGFVVTTPAVWPLAAAPVLIGCVVASLVGFVGARAAYGYAASLPSEGALAWGFARLAAMVLLPALAVVLAVAFAAVVSQPLAGPALERLAKRSEEALGGGAWPPTSAWLDVLRAGGSALLGLALAVPAWVVLSALGLLLPPVAVVTVPLQIGATMFAVAWDLCDFPLSLRGRTLSERLSFVFGHWRAVLGFATAVGLFGLLPCVGLLVLPAGVAGAARLVLAAERAQSAGPAA